MYEIFISYRRDDSDIPTDFIFKELTSKFGKSQVFKDIDAIPPGSDFREVIEHTLDSCKVALVVIGKHWLDAKDQHGNRRLDDPVDFVRLEIETLLRRNIPVIPILLGGVTMPSETDLPNSIAPIRGKQAQTIQPGPSFQHDIDSLIEIVGRSVKPQRLNYPRLMRAYIIGWLIPLAAGLIDLIAHGFMSPLPANNFYDNLGIVSALVGLFIFFGSWIYALVKAIQLRSVVWMVLLLAVFASCVIQVGVILLPLIIPIFAFIGPTRRQVPSSI